MRRKVLEGWDKEFINVPLPTLFDMILVTFEFSWGFVNFKVTYSQAANFLDLKPMLDVTCKAVAEMIKGSPPIIF